MKSCEKAYLQMNLRLDGILPPEENTALEQHLHTCAACRQRWEQLSTMTLLLKEAQEPVPEQLHSQIMTAIRQEQQQEKPAKPAQKHRFFSKRLMGAAASLAACGVLVFAATQFLHGGGKTMDAAACNTSGAYSSTNASRPGNYESADVLWGGSADDAETPALGDVYTSPTMMAPDLESGAKENTVEENKAGLSAVYLAWGRRDALPETLKARLTTCEVQGESYDCLELSPEEAAALLEELSPDFTLETAEDSTEETVNAVRILFRWEE